jgi:hypothetical protein
MFKVSSDDVRLEVNVKYPEVYKRSLEDMYRYELPEYWFKDDSPRGNVAEVIYTYKRDITGNIVFIGKVEHMIIYPGVMACTCNNLFGPFSKRALPIFVRYILLHEFRHCWQVEYAKDILKGDSLISVFPSLDPKEKDADTFVLSTVRNSYEDAIFTYIEYASRPNFGFSSISRTLLLFYKAIFYILRGE